MAKCKRCGKGGLFQKVDAQGLCETCAYEEYKQKDWEEYQANKQREIEEHQAKMSSFAQEAEEFEAKYNAAKSQYEQIVADAEAEAIRNAQGKLDDLETKAASLRLQIKDLDDQKRAADEDLAAKEKKGISADNRLAKNKELLKSIQYAIKRVSDSPNYALSHDEEEMIQEAEEFLLPTVALKLNCMNVRQLRKEFNQNQRLIKELLTKYSKRYTTKANIAIYRLMVIALEAELQNILYNIGYGKLDKAVSNVMLVTEKYEKIASDGNQQIAPTIKRFIGEAEHLFIRAVEIEYEYYVQKERIKEEQRAIREQMREEAAERKELERQRKHIEKEESKYTSEMQAVAEQMRNEQDALVIQQLEERLARLQEQLKAVNETKEEILKLQTGKAGNIYIISNLGSFGDNVFKIGMTRRLDPTERVRELGSASVPFPFDVHSFIFSDNAVGLESELHKRLHEKRLNKVNLRKEFFSTTVDELEDMVYELEPTAEFNRTMLAEQYNQSLSIDEIPEEINWTDLPDDDEVDDDEDIENEE